MTSGLVADQLPQKFILGFRTMEQLAFRMALRIEVIQPPFKIYYGKLNKFTRLSLGLLVWHSIGWILLSCKCKKADPEWDGL